MKRDVQFDLFGDSFLDATWRRARYVHLSWSVPCSWNLGWGCFHEALLEQVRVKSFVSFVQFRKPCQLEFFMFPSCAYDLRRSNVKIKWQQL